MVSKLSKVLNDLNTYVVPDLCFGCNAPLYRGEQLLCAFCRNELPLAEFDFERENAVDHLFYGRARVAKAAAFLLYREGGMVQRLIHALKYRGQERIGACLGRWYACCLRKDQGLGGIDLVLPVPLHPARKRKRGYNQCSLFGREVALALGADYTETLLARVRSTSTQTRRNRWLRWQGTSGVFRVPHPGQLEGKSILLVDDVITTGATLEACCQALTDAVGDLRIHIAALACVPRLPTS